MIAYKGFNVYVVDATTLAELDYIGRIEISITDINTSASGGVGNYGVAVSILQNMFSNYLQLTGCLSPTNARNTLTKMQELIPISVYRDLSGYLGSKIKLVGSDGSYAISTDNITNFVSNNIIYGYGVTSGNYVAYNPDNSYVGTLYLGAFIDNSGSSISVIGVPNFNGTIPLGYPWRIYPVEITCYWNFVESDYRIYKTDKQLNDATINWLNRLTPLPPEVTDPYTPGGESTSNESGEGGGTGDFDNSSDSIDFPNLPSLSASDTGFITLYNPSSAELKSLANYLWGSLFDITTYKKLFADPMDCILGLSIVPVNVPSSGVQTVTVGNISTGISLTKASSQYVEVDCGTINVNEYWGSYLDYAPYTQCELYLPYVGTHAISVDDIMGKSVHIKYHVDILSGACVAYVKCGNSVLYSFIGQCSSSIPITANDWTNVINGIITIAGAVGSMIATGGATAPLAVGAVASTSFNSIKPQVEKSGSMSGTGGLLAIQKPYLILTRPRQALPSKQNTYIGYPSFTTVELSNLEGYTEIESIHIENVSATENEMSELESILKGGVIF